MITLAEAAFWLALILSPLAVLRWRRSTVIVRYRERTAGAFWNYVRTPGSDEELWTEYAQQEMREREAIDAPLWKWTP